MTVTARTLTALILSLGVVPPLAAQDVWSPMHGVRPPERERHALAYDPQRDRVVLFGGRDGGAALGDTWEWDGADWSQVGAAGPTPRYDHAMVYDVSRGRVVLFGGDDGANVLGDTWEWDGASWALVPGAGPSARSAHAMSYDAARGRAVLFGGDDGAAPLGDTWELGAAGWASVAVTGGPAARSAHAMAHDVLRGRTVLFGGVGSQARYGDTWEWDGASWTRGTKGGPAARSGHAMAYDPRRDRVVLFGGDSGSTLLGETWVLHAAGWVRAVGREPSARAGHAMVSDGRARRLVMFGGADGGLLAETWLFSCTPWCDLGQAASGLHGAPSLVGQGELVGSSSMTLTLSNVRAQSTAVLLAGVAPLNVPFAGGAIVPNPIVTLPLPTQGTTGAPAAVTVGPLNLPSETPAGGPMYFQFWLLDAGAAVGLAASNAVVGTTRLSLYDRISLDFGSMLRQAAPPAAALPIYSVQDFTNRVFVRNPACWAARVDLTGISPWNQAYANLRAGTLVSPRHVVFAKHYPLSTAAGNNEIAFVTRDNVTVIRKIVGLSYPVADVGVAVLDADVPPDIKYYKVPPRDWSTYLPSTNSLPMLHLDQEEKALVRDMSPLVAGASYCSHKVPQNPTRRSFFEILISGDSGNPAFILVSGEPILMLTHHFSTAGPFYTTHIDVVNAAMTQLGGGYQLTEADFSAVVR